MPYLFLLGAIICSGLLSITAKYSIRKMKMEKIYLRFIIS